MSTRRSPLGCTGAVHIKEPSVTFSGKATERSVKLHPLLSRGRCHLSAASRAGAAPWSPDRAPRPPGRVQEPTVQRSWARRRGGSSLPRRPSNVTSALPGLSVLG